MNNVYFACAPCRVYVDAGYRHAYWTLEESGVVNRREPINALSVLDATDYWDVETAGWLKDLLPATKRFLNEHSDHLVGFGDAEELALPCSDDPNWFEWLMEAGFVLEELPRYYVERLGLRRWEDVVSRVRVSESRVGGSSPSSNWRLKGSSQIWLRSSLCPRLSGHMLTSVCYKLGCLEDTCREGQKA